MKLENDAVSRMVRSRTMLMKSTVLYCQFCFHRVQTRFHNRGTANRVTAVHYTWYRGNEWFQAWRSCHYKTSVHFKL